MLSNTGLFSKIRSGENIDTTDRKFNIQSTSTQYALHPLSSSATLCNPQPTFNFRSNTTFVRCSQRFDTRNKRKLHPAYKTEQAYHTNRRTTPAPAPHHSTLRPLCHLYNAGLPPNCLVKLQFRFRLCAQVRLLDQVHITPTDTAQARRCDCRDRARLAKQIGLHATCTRLSIIHAGHVPANSVHAD